MDKPTWHIVCLLHIEADTPEAAYEVLCTSMGSLAPKVDWESTDDWYDDEGASLDHERVHDICANSDALGNCR